MTTIRTSDFDYHLPEEFIAARPADRRDHARLLHYDRATSALAHRHIFDLPSLLRAGDLLVVNDSRVIPARLLGRRVPGGGRVEVLLVRPCPADAVPSRPTNVTRWEALVRPGKRIRPGDVIVFDPDRLQGVVAGYGSEPGSRTLDLEWHGESWEQVLQQIGKTPLPPYILRRRQSGHVTYPWDDDLTTPEDRLRYQTVYAREPGSVAAPTAGLHFTPEILEELDRRRVERVAVTLHIGPGTFVRVEAENPTEHPMHQEEFEVSAETAARIEQARKEGRRIVAVGTTVVRVLEHLASENDAVVPGRGATRLLILPGYTFRVINALLTNFHLPRSTLLMLVSAFAGPEAIRHAYEEAIQERYRFYSYGDAMFIE